VPPFADYLSTSLPVLSAGARGRHSLLNKQAWGCCAEYLSETAGWERWNVEESEGNQRLRRSGFPIFGRRQRGEQRDVAYA
jgi:hypothetical protein